MLKMRLQQTHSWLMSRANKEKATAFCQNHAIPPASLESYEQYFDKKILDFLNSKEDLPRAFGLILLCAIAEGNVSIVDYWAKNKLPMLRGSYSEHPITIACEYGHANIVKILLQDRKHYNDLMRYAVMGACRNGHANIIKILIEAGVQIEGKLYDIDRCMSPLPVHQSLNGISFLLAQGVNPHLFYKEDEDILFDASYMDDPAYQPLMRRFIEFGAGMLTSEGMDDTLCRLYDVPKLFFNNFFEKQTCLKYKRLQYALFKEAVFELDAVSLGQLLKVLNDKFGEKYLDGYEDGGGWKRAENLFEDFEDRPTILDPDLIHAITGYYREQSDTWKAFLDDLKTELGPTFGGGNVFKSLLEREVYVMKDAFRVDVHLSQSLNNVDKMIPYQVGSVLSKSSTILADNPLSGGAKDALAHVATYLSRRDRESVLLTAKSGIERFSEKYHFKKAIGKRSGAIAEEKTIIGPSGF